MKIIIKQEDLRKHNPMAFALTNSLYRNRTIKPKNVYNRKKVKVDD